MDSFKSGEPVILKKERLDFEQGVTAHQPNVGIVQNYVRPTGLQPKVLVRWHKGYSRFYTEEQLEKQRP